MAALKSKSHRRLASLLVYSLEKLVDMVSRLSGMQQAAPMQLQVLPLKQSARPLHRRRRGNDEY